MAGALVRFEHSSRGYIDVMKSAEVRADMQKRADAVRAAAAPNTDSELTADTTQGLTRAGGTVIGVWMSEEMKDRVLGSAIDAAGNV